MNLPRGERFKRENITVIGIIPGPGGPSSLLVAPPDVKIKIFQTITIYPKLKEFIISVNKSTMKKYPLVYHSVLQTSAKDVA